MKLQEVRNMLGNDFEDIISEFKREGIQLSIFDVLQEVHISIS